MITTQYMHPHWRSCDVMIPLNYIMITYMRFFFIIKFVRVNFVIRGSRHTVLTIVSKL